MKIKTNLIRVRVTDNQRVKIYALIKKSGFKKYSDFFWKTIEMLKDKQIKNS